METIIRWIEQHELPCFYRSVFGMECPGCGTQRAFVLLLKGEILQSFFTYPPLALLIGLFVFLSLHLLFKFRNGGTYLLYFFLFTVCSVLLNFISRLIDHS